MGWGFLRVIVTCYGGILLTGRAVSTIAARTDRLYLSGRGVVFQREGGCTSGDDMWRTSGNDGERWEGIPMNWHRLTGERELLPRALAGGDFSLDGVQAGEIVSDR